MRCRHAYCFFLIGLFTVFLGAAIRAQDLTAASLWSAAYWSSQPRIEAIFGGGLSLTLDHEGSYGVATALVNVDLDATPILVINVHSLTPGASWVFKCDTSQYDPAHPRDIQPIPSGGDKSGIYVIDLRELGGWRGRENLEFRLFALGPLHSRVEFRQIRLLPDVSARAPIFPDGMAVLTSGEWKLRLYAEAHRLVISRDGALGGITVALPGDTVPTVQTIEDATGRTLIVRSAAPWATFETRISAMNRPIGLFHWTVDATWTQPHALEPAEPECRYAIPQAKPDDDAPTLSVLAAHRFGQMGWETGQAFLPSDAALGGTALYVQDLTRLNPYFEATHTSARETVVATPDAFGYRPPVNPQISLPTGTRLRLSDSYVALSTEPCIGPTAIASRYLDLMARIYDAIPCPETVYDDWQDLARRTLQDLLSPGCWSNPDRGYLRNYLNEGATPTSAELLVQVDPLVATLAYEQKYKTSSPVSRRIVQSLSDFYVLAIGCVNNSNTDHHPTKTDSWYRVYSLVQLARAAMMGVPVAKELVHDSLTSTMSLAHKCGYEFPVFFNPTTLGDFAYSEPDCVGAYAYLMLQAYDLFGDRKLLVEARNALQHIEAHGLDFSYELQLTALTAVACARMWKITGEASYLRLSLIPVANLIRRCWLWSPGYGSLKGSHLFFGLSAMPGVYVAPMEHYQAWIALREYDRIAHDALPSAVQDLVSEFIRYSPSVLRSTLPPLMPPGSVVAVNDRGKKNDLGLLIPVEDVNDGWSQAGHIGQEIYGSGGPMAIAVEAYTLIPDAGISIYSETNLLSAEWDAASHVLKIKVSGGAQHEALIAIRYDPAKSGWAADTKRMIDAAVPITDRQEEKHVLRFRIAGGQIITVK